VTALHTQIDAGEIAWLMIQSANLRGATGLQRGAINTTVLRDREYNRKQILEALQQLTEVEGGFDYTITPLDPTVTGGTLGAFNVIARAGVDVSAAVRFEQGEGTLDNVLTSGWQIDLPVNLAIALGAQDPNTGLTLTATEADDVSQAKWGVYERQESFSDVSVLATLNQHAAEMLRPDPVETVTFDPDVDTAPWPWEDYWLGDTVAYRFETDAGRVAGTTRVLGVEIELDDQGNEVAHRLTLGEQHPKRFPVDTLRDINRRLSALER
jgi:hypothetical protein